MKSKGLLAFSTMRNENGLTFLYCFSRNFDMQMCVCMCVCLALPPETQDVADSCHEGEGLNSEFPIKSH